MFQIHNTKWMGFSAENHLLVGTVSVYSLTVKHLMVEQPPLISPPQLFKGLNHIDE